MSRLQHPGGPLLWTSTELRPDTAGSSLEHTNFHLAARRCRQKTCVRTVPLQAELFLLAKGVTSFNKRCARFMLHAGLHKRHDIECECDVEIVTDTSSARVLSVRAVGLKEVEAAGGGRVTSNDTKGSSLSLSVNWNSGSNGVLQLHGDVFGLARLALSASEASRRCCGVTFVTRSRQTATSLSDETAPPQDQ